MEEQNFLQDGTEYALITQVGDDGLQQTILQPVVDTGEGQAIVQLEHLPQSTQEQIQAQIVQSLVQSGQFTQQVMVEQPGVVELTQLTDISQLTGHHTQITTTEAALLPVEETRATVFDSKSLITSKKPKQLEVKPPVGKGPFKCEICHRMLQRWAQYQRHLRAHEDDKPFRCNQCEATFNIEENLQLHLAIHNTDNPVCPECGKKFSRIASLKAHIMMHEKEENLICPECGDEYPVQSQLNRHIQEHREEEQGTKVYSCKSCVAEFPKLSLLREHMKVHNKIRHSLSHRNYKKVIDRSHFPHKCKYCEKSFQKPSQLQRHVRIHTGERPFKCSICDKAFNQKGALQVHMTKHTGDRPFMCDFCPMTFAQRGNLRAHIKRVHTPQDGETPVFQCESCTCVFRKLGSLNAHISRMHTDVQVQQRYDGIPTKAEGQENIPPEREAMEPNVTDVIQQLLELSEHNPEQAAAVQQAHLQSQGTSSSDILQQALADSGLPSSQKNQAAAAPPVSGTVVTTASTIEAIQAARAEVEGTTLPPPTVTTAIHDAATGTTKRHIVRKVNGVRWHQCMYCTKEFKKPSDLVRHIRIHTHEKPYKCSQCFRSFAVKSTLTAHLKTHTGIKEFRCHVCDKLFSTQGSLKVHLRLHTGAKPFDCPHCDKKFRTSGHRKSHIQSHNRMEEVEERVTKRVLRKMTQKDNLPDIPLQEPILITDTGFIQQQPRNSQLYSQYLGDSSSVDRPYKCQTCLRGFKKSSHLKQHVRSHTGEKPYQCVQCLKSFVSSGVLKAHIRTHTGVKNYKCLICNSTFTTNGSLKRHMSTHSEVRPFMCPYCQKTFKTSVNCKKHMKTHKPDLAIQVIQQQTGASVESLNNENSAGSPDTLHDQVTEVDENPTVSVELAQQTVTLTAVTADQENTTSAQAIQQVMEERDLTEQVMGGDQNLQHVVQDDLTHGLAEATLQEQNVIQDAIVDHQLHNSLSQQNGFVGGQTFTQSLLSGNLTSTPLSIGQLTISSAQITQQLLQAGIDVNNLAGLAQGTINSTSMQNLLQTSEALTSSQPEPEEPSFDQQIEDSKRIFTCEFCQRSFKKSSHLKQHIRSHTGEKPYSCPQCDRKFVSMGVLKTHIKTHTGIKDYQCHICQSNFTTNGSLSRHMMIHSSVRPFKCITCGMAFRTSMLLKRHVKEHKEEEEDKTSRRAKTVLTLTEEQAEQLCQTELEEGMSVSEQILIQSAAEKTRVSEIKAKEDMSSLPKWAHQCRECPKSFKKPSDLVRHMRTHTGEKPYICNICGRSFTVKSTLLSHIRTHKGVEKTFQCHVCNSSFSTKGSLKVHMRLHTGAKPFKCPHCDEQFRTSGHRKSHIANHFRPAPPKKRRSSHRVSEAHSDGVAAAGVSLAGMDQTLLQTANMMPVLNLGDQIAISDTGLSTQLLQGLEGIQLQLSGASLGQGIQITGLDPSLLSQTVQIDAGLLQQLQQQGNLNITINPGPGIVAADPNLVQNIAVQQPAQPEPPPQPAAGQVVSITPVTVMQDSLNDTTSQFNMTNDQVVEQVTSKVEEGTEIQEEEVEEPTDLEPLEDVHNIIQEESISAADAAVPPAVDEERKHVCQTCNKAFKRAGHLKDHMMTHRPTEARTIKQTPHSCQYCGKSFAKPSQLERHTRIHTGERPFVCTTCEKAFNQKNALQVHMKKHSGEKPYTCPYCVAAFTQKGNLKIHIKRMHHKEMVESMKLPGGGPPSTIMSSDVTGDEDGVGPQTGDLPGVVPAEFLLE